MGSKLKVTQVTIKDVLGAREFAMEPGQITVLQGSNGTGKTTALESLKNAIGGGTLAKIRRIPQAIDDDPAPEIVLVLENDKEHYRVEKNGKAVRVRKRVADTQGLEDVVQPQRWLSSLYDGPMSNPISFLNSSNKERVLLLLEALPVSFDRDELWGSLGVAKKDFGAVPESLHPITELGLIRETIFRERTGVNRDAKAKAQTAEQTRRATPAVLPPDTDGKIKALEEEVSETENDSTKRISDVKGEAEIEAQAIKNNYQALAARKRAELEKEIAKGLDETREEIDLVAQKRNQDLDALFAEQQKVGVKARELATLREQAKAGQKALILAEQADQFEQEAAELEEKSEQLTTAIERVDAFTRSLLDNLPIKGLGVDGKEITINGIPFDQDNTANKIKTAVQISCLRARKSKLPFVWVDGAEALDSNNFDIMCDQLKAENVQALIGRVTDEPFSVVNK